MKKIAICGGHLTPALALIEELKKQKGIEIVFIGRKHSTEGSTSLSAEFQIITKQNIKFYPLTTGRLQRKFTKYTLFSLLKIPLGFVQSFIYLLINRPNLIISFGGYLSTPTIFSGWLLGINSITHEQSVIPGLSNKLNSLFVDKIFITWPQTQKYFLKEKTELIGNLARVSIFNLKARDKKIGHFCKNKNIIYVTGGNQGSHFLNSLIFDLLPKLNKYNIIHQLGTVNYKGDLDKAKQIHKNNYLAVDYLDKTNIGAVLNKSDLIISRSGANTVWDLAVLAKPSILIPLPIAASGEQLANAQILQNSKSAIIISQKEATQNLLLAKIDQMFKNIGQFQKHADNFQKSLPLNSTSKIIGYIQNN